MSTCTPGVATLPDSEFPAHLRHFLDLFNAGEFWESHEVLEVPWRASGSGFYHGLILYASAFVHVKRDNAHGIAAQLRKAEDALRPYEPVYLGVDVRRIRSDAAALRRLVEADAESSGLPGQPWRDRVDFPRIHLDSDRLLGSEPELDHGV